MRSNARAARHDDLRRRLYQKSHGRPQPECKAGILPARAQAEDSLPEPRGVEGPVEGSPKGAEASDCGVYSFWNVAAQSAAGDESISSV
mmetsp:Transcript_89412/g.278214  ORF Transcript_89412/g.278214 Transcript_89412/m.278214 type:complete len:89 (+) Transcript_89412:232-498(+)